MTFSSLLLLPKDTFTDLLSLERSALARSRLPTCANEIGGNRNGVRSQQEGKGQRPEVVSGEHVPCSACMASRASQHTQRQQMERGVGSGLQCRAQQKGQAVLQAALTVPASSFTSSRGLPGTTAGRQGSGGSTGEAAKAGQPTWEALKRGHAKIHAPATKQVSSAIIDPRTRLVQVRVEGHLLHVVALAQLHKRLTRRVGPVEHLRSGTGE